MSKWTFCKVAFVDEAWDNMGVLKVAIETSSKMKERGIEAGRGPYKLSCFPKTLVGMADVKLSPNSSLYALEEEIIKLKPGRYRNHIILPVLNIYHPFSMCVAIITLMRQSKMNFGFVQRVCDFVWKDASG
jgi:hypothetical protein